MNNNKTFFSNNNHIKISPLLLLKDNITNVIKLGLGLFYVKDDIDIVTVNKQEKILNQNNIENLFKVNDNNIIIKKTNDMQNIIQSNNEEYQNFIVSINTILNFINNSPFMKSLLDSLFNKRNIDDFQEDILTFIPSNFEYVPDVFNYLNHLENKNNNYNDFYNTRFYNKKLCLEMDLQKFNDFIFYTKGNNLLNIQTKTPDPKTSSYKQTLLEGKKMFDFLTNENHFILNEDFISLGNNFYNFIIKKLYGEEIDTKDFLKYFYPILLSLLSSLNEKERKDLLFEIIFGNLNEFIEKNPQDYDNIFKKIIKCSLDVNNNYINERIKIFIGFNLINIILFIFNDIKASSQDYKSIYLNNYLSDKIRNFTNKYSNMFFNEEQFYSVCKSIINIMKKIDNKIRINNFKITDLFDSNINVFYSLENINNNIKKIETDKQKIIQQTLKFTNNIKKMFKNNNNISFLNDITKNNNISEYVEYSNLFSLNKYKKILTKSMVKNASFSSHYAISLYLNEYSNKLDLFTILEIVKIVIEEFALYMKKYDPNVLEYIFILVYALSENNIYKSYIEYLNLNKTKKSNIKINNNKETQTNNINKQKVVSNNKGNKIINEQNLTKQYNLEQLNKDFNKGFKCFLNFLYNTLTLTEKEVEIYDDFICLYENNKTNINNCPKKIQDTKVICDEINKFSYNIRNLEDKITSNKIYDTLLQIIITSAKVIEKTQLNDDDLYTIKKIYQKMYHDKKMLKSIKHDILFEEIKLINQLQKKINLFKKNTLKLHNNIDDNLINYNILIDLYHDTSSDNFHIKLNKHDLKTTIGKIIYSKIKIEKQKHNLLNKLGEYIKEIKELNSNKEINELNKNPKEIDKLNNPKEIDKLNNDKEIDKLNNDKEIDKLNNDKEIEKTNNSNNNNNNNIITEKENLDILNKEFNLGFNCIINKANNILLLTKKISKMNDDLLCLYKNNETSIRRSNKKIANIIKLFDETFINYQTLCNNEEQLSNILSDPFKTISEIINRNNNNNNNNFNFNKYQLNDIEICNIKKDFQKFYNNGKTYKNFINKLSSYIDDINKLIKQIALFNKDTLELPNVNYDLIDRADLIDLHKNLYNIKKNNDNDMIKKMLKKIKQAKNNVSMIHEKILLQFIKMKVISIDLKSISKELKLMNDSLINKKNNL